MWSTQKDLSSCFIHSQQQLLSHNHSLSPDHLLLPMSWSVLSTSVSWNHHHHYLSRTLLLICPVICWAFIAFIQRVEDLFSVVLSAVMHMEGVMRRLFKNMSKSLGKMLECNKEECSVKLRGMIWLYLKVRLHHALRISNRQHKITGGKRNRKMMKLMHVWLYATACVIINTNIFIIVYSVHQITNIIGLYDGLSTIWHHYLNQWWHISVNTEYIKFVYVIKR